MMKGFRPNWGKKNQKVKIPVVIAILTMDQAILTGLMQFIIHCLGRNGDPACPFQFNYIMVENHRPVEYARNLAVHEFMKVTEGHKNARLWFIDNDMVPPADYEKQLQIDADMGAGRVYGVMGHQLFGCIQRYIDGELRHLAIDDKANNTVQVDASGTGGLWISRKVFEDERMWITDEKDVFRTLHYPNGMVKRSEDLDFTHRATQLGYTLKANLGVKWAHYKNIDLRSLEGRAASSMMNDQLDQMKAAMVENALGAAENKPLHPFREKV